MNEALSNLLNLDSRVWFDLGPQLTCEEAETFAAFLTAAQRPDLSNALLESHIDADEPGDIYHKETA